MATKQENEPEPYETNEMLRRILAAVEPAKHKPVIEILTAIVLSLATVGSAWCAYQSKVWSGEQNARVNAGFRAGREASLNNLAALQLRSFDASMFIEFMSARAAGNKELEDFLRARFRNEMKPALEAWLATTKEPTAPGAPPSPLHMPEYQPKESIEAARQNDLAEQALTDARTARGFSDNYILLTVLFATVLFFGGISRTFVSHRIQTLFMGVAVVLFLVTLYALQTLPVCHG